MALNVSPKLGPSGRPILNLKLSASSPEPPKTNQRTPPAVSSKRSTKPTKPKAPRPPMSAAWRFLRERYPATFVELKPLAIGAGAAIREAAVAAGHDEKEMRQLMGRFFRGSRRYVAAVAAEGSMRHDLEGKPVEPVSDEHRLEAQSRRREFQLKTPAGA